LRIAEQYVREFGQLARDAQSTLIVPANLTDIASMIGVATSVLKAPGSDNRPAPPLTPAPAPRA